MHNCISSINSLNFPRFNLIGSYIKCIGIHCHNFKNNSLTLNIIISLLLNLNVSQFTLPSQINSTIKFKVRVIIIYIYYYN